MKKLKLILDGVVTFTPSWADELITPIFGAYGGRVKLMHSDNPSVEATLRLQAKIKQLLSILLNKSY